ncbi:MAG: doubled protein [Bacteroidetes bacterium]|nr:doubled protein [Bacteroidota bacterium]
MTVRSDTAAAARRFIPGMLLAVSLAAPCAGPPALAQENEECLACHGDVTLTAERNGRTISLYVSEKKLGVSAHASQPCVTCHTDLAGKEFPHEEPPARVECATCHGEIVDQHTMSLHGKAFARKDPLAPGCTTCHGTHEILPSKNHRSDTSPLRIPYLCGKCHQEGAPVARQRPIHQSNILENYSESIHGEGLLRKGLSVSANCASCHTAHMILPHTDPRSSIARRNIASTCATCHAEIESVHRKVIQGKLWEQEAHVLPACVDCHQPHKVRKVFYTQGMADSDCLRCHEGGDIRSSKDGHSLRISGKDLSHSRHAKVACSQCHSEVSASRRRACETITKQVDCAACHAEEGQQFAGSMHGTLTAKNDPNAPGCKECHGTHKILGKKDPLSRTFPTNVPDLCASCHREGEKAAVRYLGTEHSIIERYTESIHGKGLLKSGLTVTAMCTDCHTAHGVRPRSDSLSSINRKNVAVTCGRCHHGIQEQFEQSIHTTATGKSEKQTPVCIDCHSAHTIRRADADGFKLDIMQKCGRCHEQITETYFDTYHGKVSQLGYTKTAKCYDCHGAHDILPVSDPRSHLSHNNVVGTCQKCHPGATRKFAGYLSHATHHDPEKYPYLFWTFWGMTALLAGTFAISGLHTLLWLPRALRMKREHARALEQAHRAATEPPPAEPDAPPADPGPQGRSQAGRDAEEGAQE